MNLDNLVLVGVDPAQRSNGVAFGRATQAHTEVQVRNVGFLEEIAGDEVFAAWCAEHKECQLLAMIECPTWSGNGTKEVKSAALAWERELNRRFEKRRIFKVDPRTWQTVLLDGVNWLGTKGASLTRARMLGVDCQSDHEADAFCLWEYARMFSMDLVSDSERKVLTFESKSARAERRSSRRRSR